MIKTFVRGLIFGLGFAISLVAVFMLMSNFKFSTSSIEPKSGRTFKEINEWNELSINEKINKSSAIAIVRFKSGEDGLKIAIVDEIYFKDSNTELEIQVGDRIEKLNFYSGKYGNDRNGEILFFVESPGVEAGKAFLYDDRLIAYGDMPLRILLDRFEKSKNRILEMPEAASNDSDKYIEEFFKLPLDDQIQHATAILLTEYKEDTDGVLKNIVVEILKRNKGIELFYGVGDEFEMTGGSEVYGDYKPAGHVIFMDRNPADMRLAMTYDEKGIRGLKNISVELLRKKCET